MGIIAATGPTTIDCARLQRVDDVGGFHRHRHSLLHEEDGDDERHRNEHVDHDPPHIDEEIAHEPFPAKCTNNGRQRTESDRRRQKLVGDAKEILAKVREVLVSRIMLQIRVGHERDHAVENGARRQHSPVKPIQRQPRPPLEPKHDKAVNEQ
jgi:hypothetical protein